MRKPPAESEFQMWRTLFAISHADEVVTKEEVRFMAEAMEDVPFTKEQQAILNDDVKHPKDIEETFKGITEPIDQARFFKYARKLVHIDGDFGADEQEIMLKLKKLHVSTVDVDTLIGKIGLELEEALEWTKEAGEAAVSSIRKGFFKRFFDGRKS